MTEKLRMMSGEEVVKVFTRHGFMQTRQKGSHVRLSLVLPTGTMHVTVPLHTELRKGTLHSVADTFATVFGTVKMREEFYSG